MKIPCLLAALLLAQLTGCATATRAPMARPERVAAFDGPMPTGITVAENGRIFINFPHWGDNPPFTVAEWRDGRALAYPNAEMNIADPAHPDKTLISVQSVVADGANRLWILDTAAPNFSKPLPGGAKLVAVDLATNQVTRTVIFGPDVVLPTSYLNDVRFDLRPNINTAYITDSGSGGIIIVNLTSGQATRRLSGHTSVIPDPNFVPLVEGQVLMFHPPDAPPSPVRIASDGIAISADGATLYYSPLSSRHMYAVPTKALRDLTLDDAALARQVRDLGIKGASDGLAEDTMGRIYAGDYEQNAIRLYERGQWRTIAQDPRILWPDTLSLSTDGYLYVTANQLHRQPMFHGAVDQRIKPYELLRIKVNAKPVFLR